MQNVTLFSSYGPAYRRLRQVSSENRIFFEAQWFRISFKQSGHVIGFFILLLDSLVDFRAVFIVIK